MQEISFALIKHELGELDTQKKNIEFYMDCINKSLENISLIETSIKEGVEQYEKLQESNRKLFGLEQSEQHNKPVFIGVSEREPQEGNEQPSPVGFRGDLNDA